MEDLNPGDYRLIRRLLLQLLSRVGGKIILRTRITQAEPGYLAETFSGANLPEGKHVQIQVATTSANGVGPAMSELGPICQCLFPRAVLETTKDDLIETVEPRLIRREHSRPNQIWLIVTVQRAKLKMKSACYARPNDVNLTRGAGAPTCWRD